MKTSPTKVRGKQRRVKAWAIINEKGLLVGEIQHMGEYMFGAASLNEKRTREFVRRNNAYWDEDKEVVPCTITYSLPKKPITRRSKKK